MRRTPGLRLLSLVLTSLACLACGSGGSPHDASVDADADAEDALTAEELEDAEADAEADDAAAVLFGDAALADDADAPDETSADTPDAPDPDGDRPPGETEPAA